jgi:hypothetical protein
MHLTSKIIGPGEHDLITSYSKTQGVGPNGTGFQFSLKGKYYRQQQESTPGPKYDVLPGLNMKRGIAFGRRMDRVQSSAGPGPAAYNPVLINKRRGISIGPKLSHSSAVYIGSAMARSVILKGFEGDH